MGDIERGRHAARILDVLPSAAGTLFGNSLTMVVKLQGDANDIVSLALEQTRHDR